MKRVWVAVALLFIILAGTLTHSFYIASFTHDLALLLEAAEAEAEQGAWNKAGDLTETARNKWDQRTIYLHIALRHDVTDQIHIGFCEVTEFIQCQESGEYSAANARLIANLELVAEAEQLTIKNIL